MSDIVLYTTPFSYPSSLAQPTSHKNFKFQISIQFSSSILHWGSAMWPSSGHFWLGGFYDVFSLMLKRGKYRRRDFFLTTSFSSLWCSSERIWCLELWLRDNKPEDQSRYQRTGWGGGAETSWQCDDIIEPLLQPWDHVPLDFLLKMLSDEYSITAQSLLIKYIQ